MEPRWKECTGIFGGAFDPPHLGHVEAVRGLLETNPHLKSVRVIPTGTPRLKDVKTRPSHRFAMAKLAFESLQPGRVEVDSCEIERSLLTGLPTFTIDTLTQLRKEIGPHIAFVIGTDQLQSLEKWARFPDVLGMSHWLILKRKGLSVEVPTWLKSSGWVSPEDSTQALWRIRLGGDQLRFLKIIETEARELSSTSIREQIERTGAPPFDCLPLEVEQYLMRERLYGSLPAHS